MYYCERCNGVTTRDHPKEVTEPDVCLQILDIDLSETVLCRGDLKPCDEFITSKELIDHVSQLQVKCSMLMSTNESLQIERDAFHDALVTTQKELKDMKEEQSLGEENP